MTTDLELMRGECMKHKSEMENLTVLSKLSLTLTKQEISCQTDIDSTIITTEFKSLVKSLKLAELSNNVMHQKNLGLQEYYEQIIAENK